eukprot:3893533-Rhodomonas_salina.1
MLNRSDVSSFWLMHSASTGVEINDASSAFWQKISVQSEELAGLRGGCGSSGEALVASVHTYSSTLSVARLPSFEIAGIPPPLSSFAPTVWNHWSHPAAIGLQRSSPALANLIQSRPRAGLAFAYLPAQETAGTNSASARCKKAGIVHITSSE